MTYAPARLLELRQYLKPWTGLPDTALGIIGDERHNGGYHHGWGSRRIVNGVVDDYSWRSVRDLANQSEAAAAIDIGLFSRLRELSIWLVGQCEAKAPDTLDIRSIIYSPDGKNVRRWDRLGRSTTGDSSHLTHTHISFFRDAEGRPKIGPFQRFFEGDNQMDQYHEDAILYTDNRIAALIAGSDTVQGTDKAPQARGQAVWPVSALKRVDTGVTELLKRPPVQSAPVDPAAMAAVIKPLLAEMEARLRAEIRDAVADLGEGGAARVRTGQ